jgi:hypothetical protein
MYNDAGDNKEAVKWTRLAAEQGHAEAQYSMGDKYQFGWLGVPQDDKEAAKWYQLAAEQGDAIAQLSLGYMYLKGDGVPQDYKEAVKWFRLVTAQGQEWSKRGLYKRIEKGNVSEVLLNFIKTVARDGDISSQMDLGQLYYDGKRIPRDLKESAKWYRLAADQADHFAQSIMGLMYEGGMGVPQDYVLAHMWSNLAASEGRKDKIKRVNELESKMTPQQIEKAKEMARNWKPKK